MYTFTSRITAGLRSFRSVVIFITNVYISIIIIVLLEVSFLVMPKVLPRVEHSEATARVEI